MAKEKTKNPAEINVEEKLKNLYALQTTLTPVSYTHLRAHET